LDRPIVSGNAHEHLNANDHHTWVSTV